MKYVEVDGYKVEIKHGARLVQCHTWEDSILDFCLLRGVRE